MNVWVVTRGEKYEGGYIVSIHLTRETAIKAALAVEAHFPGGWRNDEIPNEADSELPPMDFWENGCDWVSVCKYEVQE